MSTDNERQPYGAMAPTVAFHTLGCKVNQHDSDMMAALFAAAGYEVVPFHDIADVYVINTCTVTHLSDRKSRQMIRRAVSQNPAAIVAVCGCYVQTAADEVARIEGVDVLIGTNERSRIVEAVEAYRQAGERQILMPSEEDLYTFEPVTHAQVSDRSRAYVKIQEGCNQFCSYCIIPYARGPLRSRRVADTVSQVQDLVRAGYREVVLTGIHIGVFGQGLQDEPGDLTALCRAILAETDLPRLRLGSIECTEITPDLVQLMAEEPRMARHLHIPLQAGADKTLSAMNRPYDTEAFRQIMREVRAAIPGIAVTTDLMVGFPGETDDDFRASLIFANDMAFSDMHIFKYSMRGGTPAAAMPDQVPAEVKDRRAKQMAVVARKNKEAYARAQIGKTLSVIIEDHHTDGGVTGHSSNYLKVYIPQDAPPAKTVATIEIIDYKDYLLQGQVTSADKADG